MPITMIIFIFLGMISCGTTLSFPNTAKDQPRVVSVSPEDGESRSELGRVEVALSCGVDPDSVYDKTFLVFPNDGGAILSDPKSLLSAIKNNEIISLAGAYNVSSDARLLSWTPQKALSPGSYQIVLTSGIRTPGLLPFTQSPENGSIPFWSTFSIAISPDGVQGNEDPMTSENIPIESSADTVDENQPLEDIPSSNSPPAGEAETTTIVDATDNEENISTSHSQIFDDIYFSEVVTDPQQDWNDTLGGNGISFDSIAGSGTIGTTDEWIEIKNGRERTVDLTSWRIEMIDGTDTTEFFATPQASLVFSGLSAVDYFETDTTLVIGNPAGDMKNTILLQLIDETENIVDELQVDDANADSLTAESYQSDENGEWNMFSATIGF